MNWYKNEFDGSVHAIVEAIDGLHYPGHRTGCGIVILGPGEPEQPEGTMCGQCELALPLPQQEEPTEAVEQTNDDGSPVEQVNEPQ